MKTHLLKIGFALALFTFVATHKLMAFTAVTSGNWSSAVTWGGTAPGSNVSGDDIIIPNGITVTLDMDVYFSGLANSFNVDGMLNSITTNQVIINQGTFSGSGTVDIQRLQFNFLGSSTFTGTLMLNILQNDGAFLSLAAIGTISDSLSLESGSLTLDIGANLTVQSNATILRNSGTISIGGGIFNSSNNYNVVYVGTSKTAGIEINSTTIQNVYVQLTDNSQTLTLGTNLRVNNTLYMDMGHLDINGNMLSLYGNLSMVAGSVFESDASSDILIQSSTTLTSGFSFSNGSSIDIFTIDFSGSGNVKLNSALGVVGEVRLNNGTLSLESGSALVMNTNSLFHVEAGSLIGNGGAFTGTAVYNVEYMGATNVTGLELTGTGLNDLTINLFSGQIFLSSTTTVGGNMHLMNGNFNLNGFNLILNGTFDQDASAAFIGNINSDLELHVSVGVNDTLCFDGSNQNLSKLTVDVTGGGNIAMCSLLRINSELSMLNGKLIINTHDLIIEIGAVITTYSDLKYIVTAGTGKLQMYVNLSAPYLVFPVGTTTNYSPASIQQVGGGTAGNFMVNVFDGVYTNGTSGFNSATTASVVNRTWEIDAAVGVTVSMNLKLGWLLASEVNGFDRTNCYISQYETSWDSYTIASAVVGLNNTFEITRSGINSLSPYAVADQNAVLDIDEELLVSGINLYPNPCSDLVTVSYANIADQYNYQVIDISGKSTSFINNGSNQFDVSKLDPGIYLLKMTNIITNEVVLKKFIKR